MSSAAPSPQVLAARLNHPDPAVRRVAVLDLSRLGGAEAAALLLGRLEAERDEGVAILIVRRLGEASCARALERLWGLYANPSTPAALAHAAVLAHDAIELAERDRAGGGK